MNKYINTLIEKSKIAQKEFEKKSQEEVDLAVKVIAKVIYDNAEMLAEMAVLETGMGNYEDKVTKNRGKAKVI
ncbi:MAG: aldehyde dehydrogenase family protein, partial [Anaerovoracaceae bacterium]